MSSPVDDERVTGPSYGTKYGESQDSAARRSPGMLVTVLASVVSLLGGIIIGLLIPNGSAPTQAASAAPTGTGVTAEQAVPVAPGQEPAPAEPTLTEEQMQAQIALLREQPRRIEGDPYAVGAVDAPVVMIEFADYRCGHCQQFNLEVKPELQAMVDDGTLRIEWRDFPIFGGDSTTVAIAARAAAQQGLFWEYNAAVMEALVGNLNPVTEEFLVEVATQAGVPDIATFQADLASPELAAEVQAEYDAALALLGQPSTPQFIVNDVYLGGSGPAEAFIGVIEEQLALVQ